MLHIDEISPRVDLAGCYHFKRAVAFDYHLPAHHFILLQRGRLDAVTADGRFTAEAGDLVCFRPANSNHYSLAADTLCFQMQVRFAEAPRERLTPCLDEVGPIPVRQPMGVCFDETWRCFENLCLAIRRQGTAANLRTQAAVWEILALLAQAATSAIAIPIDQPDPWRRAKQRIEATLNRSVPVTTLAAEMGVSASYFIREFARRFGITPKACHTRARLHEGMRWLRHGDKTVKSVALELGFADAKTFTRRFRHHFGLRPTELMRGHLPVGSAASGERFGELFPINQHLLPPDKAERDLAVYMPKSNRVLTSREYRQTLEMIRHPSRFA